MSLTAGSGPFGERPRGRFDAEMPSRVLFIEDVWPRIRGVASGETVVDSPSAKLVHETGRLPVYHFPVGEVRMDLLVPTDSRSDTARGALAWHDLRVGGRVVPRAAWTYDPPAESAPWLDGLVAFTWDALDSWFAEAEELFGHPRDPYSRIDVCRTTRHVRVLLGDVVLADSRRARALYEAALPPRWYLPWDDVRVELLEPSGSLTRCAYKGVASYWNVRLPSGSAVPDLVWSYPDPQHDAVPVRDMACFFSERVDVELDGVVEERPVTQWSDTPSLRGLMGRPEA